MFLKNLHEFVACFTVPLLVSFYVADYPNDTYSDNNPYNSICSRGDLLIPSDRSPDGCYDTKVRPWL